MSVIPRNIFTPYAKKIHTKYDKICIYEKNPHNKYPHEKKSWVKWCGISPLFKKACPDLSEII